MASYEENQTYIQTLWNEMMSDEEVEPYEDSSSECERSHDESSRSSSSYVPSKIKKLRTRKIHLSSFKMLLLQRYKKKKDRSTNN